MEHCLAQIKIRQNVCDCVVFRRFSLIQGLCWSYDVSFVAVIPQVIPDTQNYPLLVTNLKRLYATSHSLTHLEDRSLREYFSVRVFVASCWPFELLNQMNVF